MHHPTTPSPGLLRQVVLTASLLGLLGMWSLTTAPNTAQAQDFRNRQLAGEFAGKAREAFGEQRYAEAAELLSKAHSLYPEPNFLWNTGRAWELAGQHARAEAAYLRFLAEDIAEEDRARAEDKLARLEALRTIPVNLQDSQDSAALDALRASNLKLQGQLASANTGNADTNGSNSGLSTLGLLGWGTAGLGIVALGATATLQLASVSTVEDYHDAANEGTDQGRYDALRDTLNARVTASRVLLVSGLLLTATGGTLLYFEYFADDGIEPETNPEPDATLSITPLLTPDTAGLGLGGRF
ncbi:MAG: hypothetical protein AAFS10_21055 [Myxococcota bacterium]